MLDVGGGVGPLHLELLRRGAARATSVELVDSYDAEADALARELRLAGRVTRCTAPRNVLARALVGAENLTRRARRQSFRVVDDPRDMDNAAADGGRLHHRLRHHGLAWDIAGFSARPIDLAALNPHDPSPAASFRDDRQQRPGAADRPIDHRAAQGQSKGLPSGHHRRA